MGGPPAVLDPGGPDPATPALRRAARCGGPLEARFHRAARGGSFLPARALDPALDRDRERAGLRGGDAGEGAEPSPPPAGHQDLGEPRYLAALGTNPGSRIPGRALLRGGGLPRGPGDPRDYPAGAPR